MSNQTLIFVGEPQSGKTVLYVRMREFMSVLVANQHRALDLPPGLRSRPARRLLNWCHGRFGAIHRTLGLEPPRASYYESQGTSERMRKLQGMLVEGRWPDATVAAVNPHEREQAHITLMRGGLLGSRHVISLRDFSGETVEMAFPSINGVQPSTPVSLTASAQAKAPHVPALQGREVEELRYFMERGCCIAFVVDGKMLYEGVLPRITERALAAIAASHLKSARKVRLACIITKRDEIDAATRRHVESPGMAVEGTGAKRLIDFYPSFWNHLRSVEAPCIEVAAVDTRINAAGERVPSITPGEFDVGIAHAVDWFITGATR